MKRETSSAVARPAVSAAIFARSRAPSIRTSTLPRSKIRARISAIPVLRRRPHRPHQCRRRLVRGITGAGGRTTTGGSDMVASETAGAISGALRWRSIGPHRGGRVVAVTGDPRDPAVFYFGACSGGIWKTDDGGTYWRNVSDGFLGSAAIGAIECAPSDANVIYAGTGEACIRNNVVAGDGVYRSTDGGASWQHLGLAATRHIGRVRVHPHDPD